MSSLRKFEVGVCNEEVRKCHEKGESHPQLSNEWAEIRYIEVEARNEQEARAKIARKYPPGLGFVIKRCLRTDEYE